MLESLSVKKPYTVVVMVILILVLGVVSITSMTTDLLPSINLPYAAVITTYIGANPESVELTVTRPVEQAMSAVTSIKQVSSISRENMSIVILEFHQTANMDSATVEMRESLDRIMAAMPEGVGSAMIMKINPSMMPIMVVTADIQGEELPNVSRLVENDILPALESANGVASATASGLVENEIHVLIEQKRVDEVNQKIQDAIQEQIDKAIATAQAEAKAQIEAQVEEAMKARATEIAGELIASGAAVPHPETGELLDVATRKPIDLQPQLAQEAAAMGQALADEMQKAMAEQTSEPQTAPSAQIEITREMVSGILKGQNFAMPAGYITEDDVEYLVRAGDKIESLDELKNLVLADLPIEGLEPVRLSDIADVVAVDNSGEQYTKVNGNQAVMITLQKQTEFSTSDVTHGVHDKMEELEKKHSGLHMTALMDQGEYVDLVVGSVLNNLIFGGILAVLILFIFLRDIRPTLVIGISIPVSVLGALALMYFSGVTMNILSMSGLALGVGMLVDNSIVVIENIYRLRNLGMSASKAAIQGAKQVAGAITASTLTTISVFLPIVFVQGISRQLFTDMGLTIAYSLLASLLIALTLVPMMMSGAMRNIKEKKHGIFSKVANGYGKLLGWSLKHKWITILVALLLLGGSVWGALRQGTQFIPAMDSPQMSVTINMPNEATHNDMTAMTDEVMKRIGNIADVETVGATDGGGGLLAMRSAIGGGGGNSMNMYVLLKDQRSMTNDEIAEEIRSKTADLDCEVDVSANMMDLSMLTGSGISIRIAGRDLETLRGIATDVAAKIVTVEGTTEISDGQEQTSPELHVVVDKNQAIAHGLTVAQVYMGIMESLVENTTTTTATFEGIDYGVIVYDDGEKELNRAGLGDLEIDSPMGDAVKVSDVAKIQESTSLMSISRQAHERYITVTAQIATGYNVGLVSAEVEKALKDYTLPAGYSLYVEGENAMIQDAFGDLYLMLALAIVFIYLIMVAQFQSLVSPFIVLFTIPLAFTGGFLALIIAGMPISIIAFVGFVILAGVIVNNGIVFVDYTNQLRQEGMSKHDALVEAGVTRLRPILMTALTTIVAMSTMTIGMGQGTEMVQPMAVTSVGGLLYGTLMTLLVVPAIYDLLHRKEKMAQSEEEE